MRYLRTGVSTLLMIGLLQEGMSTQGACVPASICAIDEKRDELSVFFAKYIGLSGDQISAIRSGQSVAKILDSPTVDEVFVFDAVYVRSTPEEYLKLASDIDALKNLPNYLAIRKFSDPPQLSDLDGLSLEEEDFKDLQECREGKCEIQLPTDAMEEFRKKVNWSSSDARDQANRVAKASMLEALKKYKEGGNAELGIYRDKNNPAAVEKAFQSLISRSKALPVYLPELQTYLLNYPKANSGHIESEFYWEKVFLITLKGSQQAGLTGLKGSIVRKVALDKTRSSLERALAATKVALERPTR
jgi:hypothetical protein